MTRVFADTFFFLAVLNRRDPAHEKALQSYGDASLHFVTMEWVLSEVANASSAPAMRPGFKRLFDLLERDTRVQIIPASHDSFRRGLELYFNRPDKEWSFTDCAWVRFYAHFECHTSMLISVMRPKGRFFERVAEAQYPHESVIEVNERLYNSISDRFTFRNNPCDPPQPPFKRIVELPNSADLERSRLDRL